MEQAGSKKRKTQRQTQRRIQIQIQRQIQEQPTDLICYMFLYILGDMLISCSVAVTSEIYATAIPWMRALDKKVS